MRFNYFFIHYLGKILRSLFFLLISFSFSCSLFSQDIEALLFAEKDSSSYRLKAIDYLQNADQFIKKSDYQQAHQFSRKGINSIYFYNSLVKDSTISSIVLLKTSLFRKYAVSSFYLGDYVESMVYYDKILDNLNYIDTTRIPHNTIIGIKARCYNGRAAIFSTQGIVSKATDNFLKSLRMYELNGDSTGIARLNNNLGIVYKNQGEAEKAEKYFFKSIEIYKNLKSESKIASIYNNLGSLFVQEKNPEKALEYLEKARELNEKLGSIRSLGHTLHSLGNAYMLEKEFNLASEYYYKAITIQSEASDDRALLDSYVSLAKLYLETGYLKKARFYLVKSEKLNDKMELLPVTVTIYQLYYELYNIKKNISKALKYHVHFKHLSDSLKAIEQRTEAARIQLNYELEKKQNELEVLNTQRELNEVKLYQKELSDRRQKIIIIIVISLLMLALVFVHIIFKRLQLNKKQQIIIQNQKMEMDHKNRILRNAYEEINDQKVEILQQRNALSGQKDKAFSLFNDLKSSIVYAKHIQNALLPDENQLQEIFSDYFVFNRPHSIVSGDFYWGRKINDWSIFAVADCTGHGVPGALMSMLGITFLNEIVKYKDVNNTAIVLGYLRKYIVNALRSTDNSKNKRDGMDIAVIAKKPESNQLFFSGANSNLYIVRDAGNPMVVDSQVIEPSAYYKDNMLFELKGDRMPIGFDEEMKKFRSRTIEIEATDQIYLFTDGYADQFGGEKDKKLKYKSFKEIILKGAHLTISEQKERIVNYMNEWMGDNRQVDDILVVGGKIHF